MYGVGVKKFSNMYILEEDPLFIKWSPIPHGGMRPSNFVLSK